jgi:hypothetical protein
MPNPNPHHRVPLVAVGDAWIVIAIIVVLFFPFGFGGGTSLPRFNAPSDGEPFTNGAGATILVSPKWQAAEDVENDGWSAPGYEGVAKATVAISTYPEKVPRQPLAEFAAEAVKELVDSVSATDMAIVEQGDIALTDGRTGYRVRYTYRSVLGTQEAGVAIVAAKGRSAAIARMWGSQDNMDDVVSRLNEPYLRTIVQPAG